MFGREREREVLDRLLDGGRGGVLVVHGEAGVGKTALLEYAVEAGREFRVARTSGVEAEMELPFAAVQQLCSPFLDLLDRLPQPQHEALGVAFGLSTGSAPDPFLVGLAVLGLLSEAAEERPLLAVVDDAHWLDHASARALAFVARRLLAEQIALLFATRQVDDALRGLPELLVSPLRHRDARALLESVLPARLDEPVLERIVVETRGNPLALLELPRGLTPTELAGGFGLPAAVPLSASIEESFTRRLASLPDDARRLLLVAAADPVGDPALVWRAAERLGIPESAADMVESEDLLVLESAGGVPSSAGSLGCLPGSHPERAARGPPRACGGDRSGSSIRIAAPGTGRRRPRSPMRTLPRSWRSLPPERKRVVVSRPPRRSWSEPRR